MSYIAKQLKDKSMKKSTIWFLAITMAVTFAGLLFTQFIYMENMIKMRKEQFKEAVQRSLYSVSTMLEEDEAQQFLTEALEDDLKAYHNHDIGDIIVQPQLAITAPDGSVTTFTFNTFKDKALAMKSKPSLKGKPNVPAPMLNAYKNMQELLRSQYLYQRGLIDDVIINILGQASSKPILERIDARKLGYYLKTELENNGLNLPFEYAVIDNKGRVVNFKNRQNTKRHIH